MNMALWIIGIGTIALGFYARHCYVLADRPGDDFGIVAWYWMAAGVTFFFALVWIVLAVIHWWPK
jgi:hypothetical protein